MGLLDKINAALDASIAKNTAALSNSGAPPWMPMPPPIPDPHTATPRTAAPRRLGDDDIDAFMQAAEERPPVYSRAPHRSHASTRESFLKEVRMKNPLRFRRLEKDVQWLRREARRAGLDPEEIRWML